MATKTMFLIGTKNGAIQTFFDGKTPSRNLMIEEPCDSLEAAVAFFHEKWGKFGIKPDYVWKVERQDYVQPVVVVDTETGAKVDPMANAFKERLDNVPPLTDGVLAAPTTKVRVRKPKYAYKAISEAIKLYDATYPNGEIAVRDDKPPRTFVQNALDQIQLDNKLTELEMEAIEVRILNEIEKMSGASGREKFKSPNLSPDEGRELLANLLRRLR